MHAGSLDNPKNAAAKVFAYLRDIHPREATTDEIGRATGSRCSSTRVSEVRKQLEMDPGRGWRVVRTYRRGLHYYRLERIAQGGQQMEIAV